MGTLLKTCYTNFSSWRAKRGHPENFWITTSLIAPRDDEKGIRNLITALKIIICLILPLPKAQADGQNVSLPIATEVGTAQPGHLPEDIEHYNQLVENISDLTERVKILEGKCATLENKPPLEGARTQAEAEATKKAVENAPLLAVNSPAMAQYNQANGLLKNDLLKKEKLDNAKEAFLYITREYPDDIYAYKSWLHIGDIQLKSKNFGEAEKAFTEALAGKLETPLMVDARLGLAEARLQKEDSKGCCEQLAIIQKEQLSAEQKQRYEAALKRAACQPEIKTEEKKLS